MNVTPRQILIFDDDQDTRDALADILRRAGYLVYVWDGEAGLEALCSQQRYHVAVVDYHLPWQNGLEVAQRLKELQPECRILLISSDLPSLGELAATSGIIDRFLAKPFSKDIFLDTIGQLCPATEP